MKNLILTLIITLPLTLWGQGWEQTYIETYDLGSIDVISQWWEHNPDLRTWKEQNDKLLISASCVHSVVDIQCILKIPCDAALIGNAAMAAPDRIEFLRSLIKTEN